MAAKLFVGNLPWNTGDEELQSLFSEAGQVTSANVIKDKFTGRSRGFGFVEMGSDADTEAAKKLNGKEIEGRAITVNEARPMGDRPERPRRDFGGGGGRGGRGGGRDFGRDSY